MQKSHYQYFAIIIIRNKLRLILLNPMGFTRSSNSSRYFKQYFKLDLQLNYRNMAYMLN